MQHETIRIIRFTSAASIAKPAALSHSGRYPHTALPSALVPMLTEKMRLNADARFQIICTDDDGNQLQRDYLETTYATREEAEAEIGRLISLDLSDA